MLVSVETGVNREDTEKDTIEDLAESNCEITSSSGTEHSANFDGNETFAAPSDLLEQDSSPINDKSLKEDNLSGAGWFMTKRCLHLFY
jgi:hypothetical protein